MTRSRQYGFWLLAIIAGIAGPFSLQPAHLIAAEPVAQGWRGNGTGVFPASQPPLQWSTSENIAWFAPLPSWSTAQPVVAGDRIFVLSEPNQLFCLSRDDGKVLWQRSNTYRDLVGEQDWPAVQKELDAAGVIRSDLKALEQRLEALTGKNRPKDPASVQAREDLEQQIDAQKQKLAGLPLALKYTVPQTHETLCGYTTATPTSDGKHVWAVFGNCLVVCYDMEGNRQWMKKLDDKPQAMWGHSASPLLVGNRLFVNIDALTLRPGTNSGVANTASAGARRSTSASATKTC